MLTRQFVVRVEVPFNKSLTLWKRNSKNYVYNTCNFCEGFYTDNI